MSGFAPGSHGVAQITRPNEFSWLAALASAWLFASRHHSGDIAIEKDMQ
jgi:hypothetical protein